MADLHSPLEKAYWNTYNCNQALEQEGTKLFGHYCGNRWCYICNRIRTAKLIKGYKPVVDEWNNPCYLVLTVRNVPCTVGDLRNKIKEMNQEWRKIIDLIRKRDDTYVEAIRTIEVTYNKKTHTLHPHFNAVLNGFWIGKIIQQEWQKHFPDGEVSMAGQYLGRTQKKTLNELFKYVVKLDAKETPPAVLDIIFRAVHGIKLVSPTGVKKVSEEVEDLISTEIPELDQVHRWWWWSDEAKDWITKNCWPDPEGVKLQDFIKMRISLFSG